MIVYIHTCVYRVPRDESYRVAKTMGCLVFICQLPQKSPIISGMVAGDAQQVFGWQRLKNCSFLQVVLRKSGNNFWSHLQTFRAGQGICWIFAKTQCNTLEHTATHYNTLQHTSAHCSTLLHTAAYCSTLLHTAACNDYHMQALVHGRHVIFI